MKIFVINLERQVERRKSIERAFGRIRMDFEVFAAVDGSRGEHVPVSRYDEAACLRHFGAPLFPGEIAVFASHYLLWQRCLERGEPMVVMEDDVELRPDFPEALALVSDLIETHRYIRLAGLFPRPVRVVRRLEGGWQLVRYLRGPAGAHCYALTPDAAAALVAHADRWLEPVDLYLDRFWQHGVKCEALMPFVAAATDGAVLPSAVGDRTFRRSGIAKWRREINRARDQAARLAYNWVHR
jgi:glycosyl transferase family 25